MIFRVLIDFLFYSPERLMNSAVVVPVFFSEFMKQRNDHRETASDASHHNLSFHDMSRADFSDDDGGRIPGVVGAVGVGARSVDVEGATCDVGGLG